MSNLSLRIFFRVPIVIACASLALSGCGGGAGGSDAANSAAASSTLTAASSTTVTWTRCASEGGICTTPTASTVRYGLNGIYFTKSVTGSIACSNGAFGDPSPGTDKFCDYSPNQAAPAQPPSPTGTPISWTRCAAEGGVCSFIGTQQVRYGINGQYALHTATAPVACDNSTFGDPAPGADKFCDYAPAAVVQPPLPNPAPISWTRCAVEGGTCSFAGTQQVRYGANGLFAMRTATASIDCTNQLFGDPAPGLNKTCEVSGNVSAPPTPTPAPTPIGANGVLTDSLFAPSSFWYQPIPANAPLHPNSANFTNELIRQKNTYYGTVDIGTVDYSSPVYIADANTPTTSVAFYDCQNKGYTPTDLLAQWAAVPIPSFAQQAGGTDGEMTVYQPSTNTLWEFWQSSKTNNTWQACWGGQMKNVSSNNGTWSGSFGTTATGLPFLGGQITAEELKRGEIRHVMGISLADLETWNIISWPAQRSDGYNPNNAPNRIPEGLRFRLDPNINVDALNMHPIGKIIAKAAQKYGFVVWDTAGNVNLRAQNAKSYTSLGQPDPYVDLFNGTASVHILNNFPWDKVKFLPMNYGKP